MGSIADALQRLHRIGGDSLVERMVAAFLANATQRIDTAREALQAGDYRSLERAVHSLKSGAGNVGAAQLMRQAAEIEALAAAGGSSRLPNLVGQLPGILQEVRERLTAERREWR